MSMQSQQKNMKKIHSLVSQNLGYIYGQRENGPNGAKKQFHSTSKAFLRALGNDLGFMEFQVTANPGGIAVSGEITLMGIWSEGSGLYLQIFQSVTGRQDFLFRSIKHMKDSSGGHNQWLRSDLFANGEYERLTDMLLKLRNPTPDKEVRHAA